MDRRVLDGISRQQQRCNTANATAATATSDDATTEGDDASATGDDASAAGDGAAAAEFTKKGKRYGGARG